MSYTILQDPEVDRQIQSDMDHISASLRESVPEVRGVILVGGFGRGEGGVCCTEGRYKPDNDYDIEVITAAPADGRFLHSLGEDLARDLGVQWVHVECHTEASLVNLPFTQYNFDLKYGSRILFGDPAILGLIPEMDPRAMPLAEGEKALFTRLWCFLGPDPAEGCDRFAVSQMSRSLLAVCDARLILRGCYDTSYRERRARYLRSFPKEEELTDLVDWAISYKLTPDIESPEARMLFGRVRRLYLEALLAFGRTVRRRAFRSLEHYAETLRGWAPKSPWKHRIREAAKTVLGRPTPDSTYVQKLRLKLYAVAAHPGETGAEDAIYSALARREAGTLTGEDTRNWDWTKLREVTLRLLDSA